MFCILLFFSISESSAHCSQLQRHARKAQNTSKSRKHFFKCSLLETFCIFTCPSCGSCVYFKMLQGCHVIGSFGAFIVGTSYIYWMLRRLLKTELNKVVYHDVYHHERRNTIIEALWFMSISK